MRLLIPSALKLPVAAIAILAVSSSVPAFATTIAYQDPAGQGSQTWGGNLALTFQVNSLITVTELGVFDALGTGVTAGPVSVGIYNGTGTLLASATFNGPYAPGGSGYDLFQSITPLALGPGNYVVDAVGFNGSYPNGNLNTGSSSGPILNSGGGAITFLGASYDGNGSLDDPGFCSSCFVPNQFDAGTFGYTVGPYTPPPPPATPEPDSLILLGTGLLGVVGMARRRVFAGR